MDILPENSALKICKSWVAGRNSLQYNGEKEEEENGGGERPQRAFVDILYGKLALRLTVTVLQC